QCQHGLRVDTLLPADRIDRAVHEFDPLRLLSGDGDDRGRIVEQLQTRHLLGERCHVRSVDRVRLEPVGLIPIRVEVIALLLEQGRESGGRLHLRQAQCKVPVLNLRHGHTFLPMAGKPRNTSCRQTPGYWARNRPPPLVPNQRVNVMPVMPSREYGDRQAMSIVGCRTARPTSTSPCTGWRARLSTLTWPAGGSA